MSRPSCKDESICDSDDDVVCLGATRSERSSNPFQQRSAASSARGRSSSDRPKSNHPSPVKKKAACSTKSDDALTVRTDHVEPVFDQLLDVLLHNKKNQTVLEEKDCTNNGKHHFAPLPFHEPVAGRDKKFSLANDKQVYKWAISHVVATGMESSRSFKELYENEGGDGGNSVYVGFEHFTTSILSAVDYVGGKAVINIKKLQRMPEEFRGVFQYRFQNPIGGGYFSIDDLLSERIIIVDLIFFAWFAKSWNGRIVEDLTLDHLFDVLGEGPGYVINYNCGSGPSIVPKLAGGRFGEKMCRKLVFGLVIPTHFLLRNCYAKVLQSERLYLRMTATKQRMGLHPFTADDNLRDVWDLHNKSAVLDFYEVEDYEEEVMKRRRAGRKDWSSVPTCESSFFRDLCASWREQKSPAAAAAATNGVEVVDLLDDEEEVGTEEELEQEYWHEGETDSAAARYSSGELAKMKDAARPSNELQSEIEAAVRNRRRVGIEQLEID